MSKIAEMRQKRGELWDKAKAFLNEHADENGMMNAEDTATYWFAPRRTSPATLP